MRVSPWPKGADGEDGLCQGHDGDAQQATGVLKGPRAEQSCFLTIFFLNFKFFLHFFKIIF